MRTFNICILAAWVLLQYSQGDTILRVRLDLILLNARFLEANKDFCHTRLRHQYEEPENLSASLSMPSDSTHQLTQVLMAFNIIM